MPRHHRSRAAAPLAQPPPLAPWGERLGRWRVPALALLSGLLLARSFPGHEIPLLWTVILVPLLLAAQEIEERPGLSWVQRLARLFGACWAMGVAWAAVTGDWMINTMFVYGGLPLPVAHLVNLAGHSLLVGAEFFAAVALPFALARGRPRWTLALVPLWAAAVQAYWPHLFMWSFGQFMWQAAPLVQAADLVGSAGLNLIYLPFQLLGFAWVRAALGRPVVTRRELVWGSALAAALCIGAWGYGAARMAQVAEAQSGPPAVRVIAIQPNFSLKRLASNPALSPSDREQSLGALLRDSESALEAAGASALPTVLVWPESVYPTAYFLNAPVRELVERWVRGRGAHLVLASVDVVRAPDSAAERSIYGISVHVPPDGAPPEVYRKIFLMPFGEFIPFADWFPWYRRLLKDWIPRIGEFERGTEYTVFPVSPEVRLAPMICYDGTQVAIAQGMAAQGANLALVLANLAWFGEGTASLQFEHVIRFRAIENRVPLLFVSQNGRTVLFDARGEPASEILPAFQARALTAEIALPNLRSAFTHHGGAVDAAFAVLALAVWGAMAWWGRRRS